MTDIRYGIFLRPDPQTCWTVIQLTHALKKQFGLVSAGAFPPHVTMIGNLQTDAPQDDLVAALDPILGKVRPFPVYNSGIELRAGGAYEYNVNLDAAGVAPNEPLGEVARRVAQAVAPISIDVDDFLVPRVSEYAFAGHIGLASHELGVDPTHSDEIGDFLHGLPLTPPASFVARWYSVFEFRSNWDEHWWKTMTWRHLHSWGGS